MFSNGVPTNRIPIILPSNGEEIIMRETTVVELKSLCKTIIDNLGRKQMDVIYDAVTDYLQSMILYGNADFNNLTEYDRMFCLMLLFHVSFYKDAMTIQCPHCGVDIVYRYDMTRYLAKMDMSNGLDGAFVEDQTIEMQYKGREYKFTVGWPNVKTMSALMHWFYSDPSKITENAERQQFGIDFVLSFVKKIEIVGETALDFGDDGISFSDRIECINSLPSVIVFDKEDGLFGKITGMFVNRL